MIYIACAIYKEAKPLIEKYNLKRIDDGKFQIFRNDTVTLIITGSGQTNAAIALTYLLYAFSTGISCTDAISSIRLGQAL